MPLNRGRHAAKAREDSPNDERSISKKMDRVTLSG